MLLILRKNAESSQGENKGFSLSRTQVTYYQHGTKTAEFLICTRCGVFLVALSLIDEQLYGVLNINTLEDIDCFTQKDFQANYEGETISQRLTRRKNSWISWIDISLLQNDRD